MPRLLVLSTCAVQGDGWRWSAIRSACLSTTRTAGDRNRWVHGLTDQVRRVEACGRQCPCTHVRVSEREVARFQNHSERMRQRPTEVALHDGKSAERRLRDVSETFGRPIANAAAANPRRAQRANAVNATCADAASASLVFIAGQRRSQRCARPGTACLHASPPHTPRCSQSRQHP